MWPGFWCRTKRSRTTRSFLSSPRASTWRQLDRRSGLLHLAYSSRSHDVTHTAGAPRLKKLSSFTPLTRKDDELTRTVPKLEFCCSSRRLEPRIIFTGSTRSGSNLGTKLAAVAENKNGKGGTITEGLRWRQERGGTACSLRPRGWNLHIKDSIRTPYCRCSFPCLGLPSSVAPNLSFVKMRFVGVTLPALAGLAAGASLKCLDTSLTILANNDLQGT